MAGEIKEFFSVSHFAARNWFWKKQKNLRVTKKHIIKKSKQWFKKSHSEEDRFDTMKTNELLSKIRLKYYDQESKSSLAGNKITALKRIQNST